MSKEQTIEQKDWGRFLSEFSDRNRGRRARFELFRRDGAVAEEGREATFDRVSVNGNTITVIRIDKAGKEDRTISDAIPNIHGITVQFDTDDSDNTIEFKNDRGDMTVLHFESLVDGDS